MTTWFARCGSRTASLGRTNVGARGFTVHLKTRSTTTVPAFVGLHKFTGVTHNGCVFRCAGAFPKVNDYIFGFWYVRLEIWVLTPFDNMVNHRAICPEADWQLWCHPYMLIWFNFSKVQVWEHITLWRACIGTLCVLFVIKSKTTRLLLKLKCSKGLWVQ